MGATGAVVSVVTGSVEVVSSVGVGFVGVGFVDAVGSVAGVEPTGTELGDVATVLVSVGGAPGSIDAGGRVEDAMGGSTVVGASVDLAITDHARRPVVLERSGASALQRST